MHPHRGTIAVCRFSIGGPITASQSRSSGTLKDSSEPEKSQPLRDGFQAEFAFAPGSSEERIVITQEPGSPGRLWNRITVEGGPGVEFNQIVLP